VPGQVAEVIEAVSDGATPPQAVPPLATSVTA
jgi:hypothetical protein